MHRLGERCHCGHLTLPARFYWEVKNDKVVEVSQEEAEQAYLEHLKEHVPERYEKLQKPHTTEPTQIERPHATNAPGRLRGRQ